ncbi:MAG TPA: response regulator [Myxococcota bacterium]|nr:response regulator [Myxococcota bacterium]
MAKARILAVDDQRYFRVYLEDLLVQQGFEVHTASSGEEALHLMERELYDVVVTDLVMPGLAGVELVERVKSRWPELDVVVVTSVGDVRTAVEAMRTGASDYLLKPLDATLLSRSLEAILQRKRLRLEHASLMAENLEYLGVLSLYERTMALFSTLAVEPLADRIVEGLCLEARAQGGIAWLARPDDPNRLRLAAARGLVRVEREAEEIAVDALPPELAPLLRPEATAFAAGSALIVPLRNEGHLLGFARLTDKLSGASFDARDRAVSERFAVPAAIAAGNALRFRALEHRSFRDPVTKAYTWAFFEDVVRNEIRKAGRFCRSFSLLKVELAGVGELRRELPDTEFAAWLERLAFQIGRVLRTTDLLAAETDSRFAVLLPETDALGAAVLKRRIGEVLERGELLRGEKPGPRLHLAAASFPVDGTQLEELSRVLGGRLAEDRDSLVHSLGLEHKPFPILLDALAGRGEALGVDAFEQVLRFVLAEVERRAVERGILCVSPGSALLPVVREGLARLDPAHTRTELVVVSDGRADALAGVPVTCVPPQQIGTRRPFLLYYAEGPAYALVGDASAAGGGLFQTSDRVLVEHLAFQLQRALGVPISR